jgi:hypothetical protein
MTKCGVQKLRTGKGSNLADLVFWKQLSNWRIVEDRGLRAAALMSSQDWQMTRLAHINAEEIRECDDKVIRFVGL